MDAFVKNCESCIILWVRFGERDIYVCIYVYIMYVCMNVHMNV